MRDAEHKTENARHVEASCLEDLTYLCTHRVGIINARDKRAGYGL